MGSYIEYQDVYGHDFGTEAVSDTNFMKLMYCCVKCACRVDHIEFNMSQDEFFDTVSIDSFHEFVENLVVPILKKNLLLHKRMSEKMKN